MNQPLESDAEVPSCEAKERRELMKAAAALALAGVARSGRSAPAATAKRSQPGEFAFLAGEWRIRHRRLKDKEQGIWDEFEGEATCWNILNGIGSIEELRIPARDFSGMGIRLLDTDKGVWNDYWVNARSPVLATPGLQGSFENGIGTFVAQEVDGDRPILVKGVWDRITADTCRWYQATSSDDGKTWSENWTMEWRRVKP